MIPLACFGAAKLVESELVGYPRKVGASLAPEGRLRAQALREESIEVTGAAPLFLPTEERCVRLVPLEQCRGHA